MTELLNQNLTLEYFDKEFTSDLQNMYANPESILQIDKEKYKTTAMSIASNFKLKIIDFYFEHGGRDMTDNDYEVLQNNFGDFYKNLIHLLSPLKRNKYYYSSVALLWTGILNQLEKESIHLDDFGLTVQTQDFLIKFFKAQTEYYSSLTK